MVTTMFALLGGATYAYADTFGVQLGAGIGSHQVKKIDLGLVWDPSLNWWEIGGGHFSLLGEAHLSYWYTNEGGVHNEIYDFSVTPIVRFIKSTGPIRPYLEGGVGLHVLSHSTINGAYSLSTAFQFGEIVGVGVQFGRRQQYLAGFRFQHESNAGIKEPNPGINSYQLYLQYNF